MPERFQSSPAALARQKAITAELAQIPLRDVMERHFGFQGKCSGRSMVKYEITPGIHLNCSTTDNWFGTFNGQAVPGLGKGGSGAGGHGAIDAVIAVRSILGEACDFRSAKRELQNAFLPHSLDGNYTSVTPAPPRPRTVDEPETPVAFQLPVRINRLEDYLGNRARAPKPMLRLPDDLQRHVAGYLSETRHLPVPLVEDLLARNAAFPSVRERELTSRHARGTYTLAEPMVVFPLTAWTDGSVVGYDYKTLPLDRTYASFAATEGRKKFGGYRVGSWDEDTRHVILTEGALDALSKWALDGPRGDTTIWAMSGARISESLLKECRIRGADVTAAFDNDRAGRLAASATLKHCATLGIRCTAEFVQPSEIEFELRGDSECRRRGEELIALCEQESIPFQLEASDAGGLVGVVANEELSMALLDRFIAADHAARIAESGSARAPATEPRLWYGVRNKDWNDVLVGEFQPRLQHGVDIALGSRALVHATPEP